MDLILSKISAMSHDVESATETANYDKFLQSGLQITVIGRQNVVKSSLLNSWSKSERSIVTNIAGTTRSQFVERSEAVVLGADVIIMAVSAIDGWTTEDAILLDKINRTKGASGSLVILAINKVDYLHTLSSSALSANLSISIFIRVVLWVKEFNIWKLQFLSL
ncbi:tRNA modification GTPase [Tanacetum coccineum]